MLLIQQPYLILEDVTVRTCRDMSHPKQRQRPFFQGTDVTPSGYKYTGTDECTQNLIVDLTVTRMSSGAFKARVTTVGGDHRAADTRVWMHKWCTNTQSCSHTNCCVFELESDRRKR